MHLEKDLRLGLTTRKTQIFHSQTSNVDSKKTCVVLGIPLAPSN
jgi:hypothetical protein